MIAESVHTGFRSDPGAASAGKATPLRRAIGPCVGISSPMVSRSPLSALPIDQLLARAAEYRRMAATASTPDTKDALNRLAVRFAMMAAKRQVEETRWTRLAPLADC